MSGETSRSHHGPPPEERESPCAVTGKFVRGQFIGRLEANS
jgi:hypothetical protein